MFLKKRSFAKLSRPIHTLGIFFCLASFLLTSCSIVGGGNTAKSLVKVPASKQIYTIPQIGINGISTLDPALTQDVTSISAVQMLFTGLVSLNDKQQVQPQLAKTWSVSPDGLTWTFHLKPHLTFSDGTPLTSSDIAYSIDRALQPATQSTVAPIYLGLIKDADQLLAGGQTTLIGDSLLTPNASTLVIITREPAAYFLDALTYPCSYVVEKSFITKYGAKFTDHLAEGGGSGPFKLGQHISNQEIDFVPNTHYYDAKPQLQLVRFAFFPTESDAYTAYLHGMVDTTSVPLSDIAAAKKRSDFVQVPQLWINYYTMNYLVKPFDNIHIRQAFALAIDKTAIANNVWKGTVLPTNHIVPQGMPGYNAHLTGPDGTQNTSGNAAKAQALFRQGLQEEGWSNVSQLPPITLTYATGLANFDQEVSAMVHMWKQVLNVRVTANPVDYNTLLARVTAATNNPHGLQFWGLAWVAEYPDPQDWLSLQFANGAPNNNMNYGQSTSANVEQQVHTQQQLATADAMMNQQNTRIQLYQSAEQQLVNDVAWMPMNQVTSTILRSPYIVGIVNNSQDMTPPDDWATIYRVQ